LIEFAPPRQLRRWAASPFSLTAIVNESQTRLIGDAYRMQAPQSRSAIATEKNRANREPFCPSPPSYLVKAAHIRGESMFYKKNFPAWEGVARIAGLR
jgi:hypothetical protein